MVQRSPSHLQTGTLYWAHVSPVSSDHKFPETKVGQHEKMCVIDRTIAFMGGLDLCFGR
jgi:phospholipase D1/2